MTRYIHFDKSQFKGKRFTNNSMLFDLLVEDNLHTTLYVKTRYTTYLYDLISSSEALALIELIKESVEWDLYTQSYDPIKFRHFREQWPEFMTQPNYNPNF